METVYVDSAVTVSRVGFDSLPTIKRINRELFHEERVINRFDRPGLIMLVAHVEDRPVGFKIGYALDTELYYSAKGGVLSPFRRRGIARLLLHELMDQSRNAGYRRLVFDTFPNKHIGMTILALSEGFHVVNADFHHHYQEYRLRFEAVLEART